MLQPFEVQCEKNIGTYSSIALLDDPESLGAVAARHHNRLARAEGVDFHVVEVHSAAPCVGDRLTDQLGELVVAATPELKHVKLCHKGVKSWHYTSKARVTPLPLRRRSGWSRGDRGNRGNRGRGLLDLFTSTHGIRCWVSAHSRGKLTRSKQRSCTSKRLKA